MRCIHKNSINIIKNNVEWLRNGVGNWMAVMMMIFSNEMPCIQKWLVVFISSAFIADVYLRNGRRHFSFSPYVIKCMRVWVRSLTESSSERSGVGSRLSGHGTLVRPALQVTDPIRDSHISIFPFKKKPENDTDRLRSRSHPIFTVINSFCIHPVCSRGHRF